MRITEFLSDLRKVGIELKVEADGALVCSAPKGAVSDQIRSTIKRHKGDIIAFLKPILRDKWTSLVPIQPSGSRKPFFCFHGVGGNVLNYSCMAEYLGEDQPLYGLQAVGLDGVRLPLSNLPSMARAYEEEIRSVQPEGPYFLGGGSMGGLVAYEMARNVLLKGETVGLLILFDTIGPNVPAECPSVNYKVRDAASDFAGLGLKPTLSLMQEKVKRKLDFRRRMKICHECMRSGEPLPLEYRFWYIEQLNFQAMGKYDTPPYPGELELIRGNVVAEDRALSDPSRGCTGVTAGLKVHAITGEHESLVEQPELGNVLARCLEEAQSKF